MASLSERMYTAWRRAQHDPTEHPSWGNLPAEQRGAWEAVAGVQPERIETIVGIVGVATNSGLRHRIPAIVFGVWCAHPGSGDLWRVSHGPTGKALFCAHADVDWWTAIRIAEEFHRTFGAEMPDASRSKAVIVGVAEIADAFIASTDWTS